MENRENKDSRPRDGADIFEVIRNDHDEIKKGFRRVSGSLNTEKSELFDELSISIRAHCSAEEEAVYPVLMQNGRTKELTEKAVADHKKVVAILDELDGKSVSVDQKWFRDQVQELERSVRKHIETEESQLFSLMKKELSGDQLDQMRKNFLAFQKQSRDLAA